MRLARFRTRSRTLMLLVAVCAGFLAFARRPHPVFGLMEDVGAIVRWSDGTTTRAPGPIPIKGDHLGPFIRVRWSDGSTSYYFCLRRGPYR